MGKIAIVLSHVFIVLTLFGILPCYSTGSNSEQTLSSSSAEYFIEPPPPPILENLNDNSSRNSLSLNFSLKVPPLNAKTEKGSAGFHFVGCATTQPLTKSFVTCLQVTNPDVPSGDYIFYSGITFCDSEATRYIIVGWAEIGWQDGKQYVFEYDTKNRTLNIFEEYAISEGQWIRVGINYQWDTTWAAWIYWNDRWELLRLADIGLSETEACAQQFSCVYTSTDYHYYATSGFYDTSFIEYEVGPHRWTTSLSTIEYADFPYRANWVNKYWDWSTDVNFGGALDISGLTWSTGGNTRWGCDTSVFYYGGASARSGLISHSQASWISTNVCGPGTLSFWWKVSSEHNYDFLHFYIDGQERARISGETDWERQSYYIPDGRHELKWEYTKDPSVSRGADTGWVDKVEFIYQPTKPDLVVTDVSCKVTHPPLDNPKIYPTGDFVVTVKNQGNAKAGSSYLDFYLDGSLIGRYFVPELPPGSSYNVAFSVEFTRQGKFSYRAVADATGLIVESNETNNERSGEVTISFILPDLTVETFSYSVIKPKREGTTVYVGDLVDFYVKVKNLGQRVTPGFRVYLYIDGVKEGEASMSNLQGGLTSGRIFSTGFLNQVHILQGWLWTH